MYRVALVMWLAGFLYLVPAQAELRDPTRPPGYAAAAAVGAVMPSRSWELTSVLISGMRKVAVLNGRSVREGDAIGDAMVVKILPTAVRLSEKGRVFTVSLVSAGAKQPAGSQ